MTGRKMPRKKHARKASTKATFNQLVPSVGHQKKHISAIRLLSALTKAAAVLSDFESEQDLRDFVEELMFEDEAILDNINQTCATLHRLLSAALRKPKESVFDPAEVISSIKPEDQFFFYRKNNSALGVLAPIEVFERATSRNQLSRKTFGFIRENGGFPLKYAVSGNVGTLKSHPQLLESNKWAMLAMTVGAYHLHTFRGDGWDAHHGKQIGSSSAAHVEVVLTLWYVCKLMPGNWESIQARIANLYELRDLHPRPKVEIFVSRAPCNSCCDFKKVIERITKVKIDFVLAPNLGQLHPERKENGYLMYPAWAEEEEAKGMQIQVVLPAKQAANAKSSKVSVGFLKNRSLHDVVASENQIANRARLQVPKPVDKISYIASESKTAFYLDTPPATPTTNGPKYIDLTESSNALRSHKRPYVEDDDCADSDGSNKSAEQYFQDLLKKKPEVRPPDQHIPKHRRSSRKMPTKDYTESYLYFEGDRREEHTFGPKKKRRRDVSTLEERFGYSPLENKTRFSV